MSVIQQFFVHDLFAGVDILDEAVTALDAGNDCNRERLRADFERRETYGQLVFEDLGIQLLHCRSDGVPEPRAGVLRYPPGTKPPGEHEAPAILVLAAPVATPPACTRVLSELVVALTEYPGFPEMLAGADRPTIQAGLLSLFSRRA